MLSDSGKVGRVVEIMRVEVHFSGSSSGRSRVGFGVPEDWVIKKEEEWIGPESDPGGFAKNVTPVVVADGVLSYQRLINGILCFFFYFYV
jgi:hypothetical protein